MIEVNMNSMDGVVLMTAGKKIEENIKVTPVASLILPEYDGAYELLVPTVSGVWVWNEIISVEGLTADADNTYIQQIVDFYISGERYAELKVEQLDNLKMLVTNSPYDDNGDLINGYGAGRTLFEWDADSYGWYNQAYRTVDFGTEPQEVSEEFYAWLTANAVKQ